MWCYGVKKVIFIIGNGWKMDKNFEWNILEKWMLDNMLYRLNIFFELVDYLYCVLKL